MRFADEALACIGTALLDDVVDVLVDVLVDATDVDALGAEAPVELVRAALVAVVAGCAVVEGFAAVPAVAGCPFDDALCGRSLRSERAVMPSLAAPTMFFDP